jgi:hypothetical protein
LAKNSGDLFDTIVTLLFIFFFVFGGLFRKKDKAKQKGTKKPYKPIFPPAQKQKEVRDREIVSPPKPDTADTMDTITDVVAEMLDKLGERKEAKTAVPEKKIWGEPEPFVDKFEDEDKTQIFIGQPTAAKKVAPKRKKAKKFSSLDEEELMERWQKKKESERKEKKAAKKAARLAEIKKHHESLAYQSLFSKNGVRDAIVMAEILNRPLALREKHLHFGR